MTDESKGSLKRKAWEGGKLLTMIGALTTAIVGYNRVVTKLELQYQVQAMKVNALTAEMSYIRGHLTGMGLKEVVDGASEESARGGGAPDHPEYIHMAPVVEDKAVHGVATTASEEPEKRPRSIEAQIKDLTYKRLPTHLDDLKQFQEQLQFQDDG